ncbi:hypothetical protein [Mycobacteroides abscessus]|uniref:hypothetical protein n=1 Tax=Mycobacteroides abscessus TaxID=36809 RepID=UPI001472BA29
MNEPSKYAQLDAQVAQAELIPADRVLTAEEIALLDDLDSQLRAAWRNDRCKELRSLLSRMNAIRRARKPATPAPAPARRPPAATPVERGPLRIRRELSEMADKQRLKQQLKRKDFTRLEKILSETGRLVAHDAEYRRLYQWALRIHKGASQTAAASKPRSGKRVGPEGLVRNPELSYGGREVLGGLPSSRRGH